MGLNVFSRWAFWYKALVLCYFLVYKSMGKPTGKKKISPGSKPVGGNGKHTKTLERNSKAFDEDTAIFINMSQELKDEGNKLF